VAKKGEIGGKVERIEIIATIGEKLIGQAHRVEADDLGAGGHEVADVIGETPGIEGGDQHEIGLHRREFGHRLRPTAEHLAADRIDVLDEDAGTGDLGDLVELAKTRSEAQRVVDGKGARARESSDQIAGEASRYRMCRRLEEAVAALVVVE